MYAEAVRLLKEGKYQEALDKWQEVRSIDPKYPDRQRVQTIARRKLIESGKAPQNKPRLVITKPIWTSIIGLISVGVVLVSITLWGRVNEQTPPSPTATSSGSLITIPTTVPASTNTPRTSTSVPTEVVRDDPLMYDDFDNPSYEGRFNTALWGADIGAGQVAQENGLLNFELSNYERDIGLGSIQSYKPTSPIFVESKIMLDPISRKGAALYVALGSEGGSQCVIYTDDGGPGSQSIYCASAFFGIAQRAYNLKITAGTWHVLRIELYPDTMTFIYLVDGKKIGSYIPRNPEKLQDLNYVFVVNMNAGTDPNRSATGYVDYVRTGKIEVAETTQTAYRWDFGTGTESWGENHHDSTIPYSKDGYLLFDSTGMDPQIFSPISLNISASQTPVITVRMRIVNGRGTIGQLFFLTDNDSDWSGRVDFPVEDDGAFHSYDILMSENPAWQGVINALRLDPVDDPSGTDMQFAIDYISVHAP